MQNQIGPPLHLALKLLRIALGWGQEQLGRAASLSRSAMSEIESGNTRINRDRLDSFAALMDAPPGAVAAALAFVAVIAPKGAESGPVEPTPDERRTIDEAVAAGAAELRAHLLGQVRRRHAEEERAEAAALWRRLAGKSATESRFVVENGPEVWSWALVEHLSHESGSEASDSAQEAIKLAELALWVAERVPGGEGWQARVQGYAWAYLSSACRVANDFERSRKALAKANDLFPRGAEEDPGLLDPVRLLDLEASFWCDQRQFTRALELHDRALAEGRGICAASGRTAEALARYPAVRRAFADRDLPLDAALVGLEEAALLLSEGRGAEVRSMVFEMRKTFESEQLHREAHVALKLFLDAAVQETATAALARQAARGLAKRPRRVAATVE